MTWSAVPAGPSPPHQRVDDGTGQGGGEAPGAEDLVRAAEVGPGAGVEGVGEAEPVVGLGGDPVRQAELPLPGGPAVRRERRGQVTAQPLAAGGPGEGAAQPLA